MIERVEVLDGKKIRHVVVRSRSDCVGQNRDEHMGYEVEIATEDGAVVTVTGCHDSGPDVELDDGRPF